MRIVTVYLKGNWAQSGKDWDRGIVQVQDNNKISIQDNEYGLNVRSYPLSNVTRIDETGHW